MNITKLTDQYISSHPSIMDALKKGVINYSALARKICDEHGLKNFDAALIACRRHYEKMRQGQAHEDEVMKLVRSAKLLVRSKMLVAIIERPRDPDTLYQLQKIIRKKKGDINMIEGEDAVTLITNGSFRQLLNESLGKRIIKVTENLVQMTLIFDQSIEQTSGVVSYVYNLLAENDVNILEEMSCWTDLMILIDEKDMSRAMVALSR
jgi:aspartokinase